MLINISKERAEKLSIMINNLFINDFFYLSQCLDEMMTFQAQKEIMELMLYLKGQIDIELNKH